MGTRCADSSFAHSLPGTGLYLKFANKNRAKEKKIWLDTTYFILSAWLSLYCLFSVISACVSPVQRYPRPGKGFGLPEAAYKGRICTLRYRLPLRAFRGRALRWPMIKSEKLLQQISAGMEVHRDDGTFRFRVDRSANALRCSRRS